MYAILLYKAYNIIRQYVTCIIIAWESLLCTWLFCMSALTVPLHLVSCSTCQSPSLNTFWCPEAAHAPASAPLSQFGSAAAAPPAPWSAPGFAGVERSNSLRSQPRNSRRTVSERTAERRAGEGDMSTCVRGARVFNLKSKVAGFVEKRTLTFGIGVSEVMFVDAIPVT